MVDSEIALGFAASEHRTPSDFTYRVALACRTGANGVVPIAARSDLARSSYFKAPSASRSRAGINAEAYCARTWFYFEEFVNPQSNWIPPDNVQEYPVRKVAFRVSPTNEGLFLASALVARDFGFIALTDLISLWEKNLRSWEQLEGLHGHPFNWYDAQTLEPLRPRYVSTVDSGNLAVCFLTVRTGADELANRPLLGHSQWQGLFDTAVVLRKCYKKFMAMPESLAIPARAEILRQIAMIESYADAPNSILQWRESFGRVARHRDGNFWST